MCVSTAQLVKAENDQQIWAESYERELRDVLAPALCEPAAECRAGVQRQFGLTVMGWTHRGTKLGTEQRRL